MRKKLLKSLLIFLLLPVLIFVGCKNKELPAINLSRYLKKEISIKTHDISQAKTADLSIITEKKPNVEYLAQYLKFEIPANNVWMYKMYVEKITFYVYCNETSEFQMIVNVKMSDLASEEDILNTKTENVETETIEEQITLTPEAKKSIKCTININKTVVNALGSTITIDTYNSRELFSGDGESNSSFTWMIYGFEIHGESRSYSR